MKKIKRYEIVEHTADIGIVVHGETIGNIFENAAYGMFCLITDLNEVLPRENITIRLHSQNLEELLVSWLNELLYRFNQTKTLFKEFKTEEIDDKQLVIEAYGEIYDEKKHILEKEIKAATYHQLKIEQAVNGKWEARIIFDI